MASKLSAVHYFAYGSNLDAEQMQDRCPSSDPHVAARLDDHRIDFTHFSKRWQGGAADVVAESGASVWGMVYRLAPADLERLDTFERGYERISVSVQGATGTAIEVVTYSVRAKGPTHTPHERYLTKMLSWGEHWEFPEEYLRLLRTFRV